MPNLSWNDLRAELDDVFEPHRRRLEASLVSAPIGVAPKVPWATLVAVAAVAVVALMVDRPASVPMVAVDASIAEPALVSEPVRPSVGAVAESSAMLRPSMAPGETSRPVGVEPVRVQKAASGILIEWDGEAPAYRLDQCWIRPGLEMCESQVVTATRFLDLRQDVPLGVATYRVLPLPSAVARGDVG